MKKFIISLAALAVFGLPAFAEERFGVTVYPGAAADAFTDAYCAKFNAEAIRQSRGGQVSESACFRTADDFTKVVGYYQHLKAVAPLGQPIDKGLQRSALFCLQGMKCASLGNGVDVIVSSPWADEKQRYEDVLITIRKAKKK
jgi:hypothetical protein